MAEHLENSRQSFSLLSLQEEALDEGSGLRPTTRKSLANLLGIAEASVPELEPVSEIHRFLDQFTTRLGWSTDVERMKREQRDQITKEYQLEEQRLQEVLKLIGITKDLLSSECQTKLTFLAKLAQGLDLRSTRFSFILAKWSELCLQHFSEQENERLVKSLFDACALMKERTLEMKEKATRAFEELSKSNEEEMLAPQTQGEAKIQQYLTEAESFKEALQQRGYTEQISHHELKKKAQNLDGIKHEIVVLSKELKEFDPQLPRDMDAAKACLNDLQKELAKVRSEVCSKVVQD